MPPQRQSKRGQLRDVDLSRRWTARWCKGGPVESSGRSRL